MEKQTYTIKDFVEIIERLRSENGCPWDREQTHESLKPCMTEEAAEVLAAIRILDKTGNPENLREELGDVLLQVVMHSQIAKEEGLFSLEDVVQEISEKMIRRHPHVFGTLQAEDSEQVLKNWEEIKKEEKQGKEWAQTPLKDIPSELPALARAQKVIKKADKLYEKQPDIVKTIESMKKQITRLEEIYSIDGTFEAQKESSDIEQIIGGLLWDISNLSRLTSLHGEQLLINKILDFVEKYE